MKRPKTQPTRPSSATPASRPSTPSTATTVADPSAGVLREAGLRVTGVRVAVLQALGRAGAALNAQQVYDAVVAAGGPGAAKRSTPDRVTVYRTLGTLVDAGLAHRVDPGDRVFRFSLTDHGRCSEHHHVHEHPHFVCDECGKVECLEGAEVVIKPGRKDAEAPRKVRQADTVLHGTCGECDEPGSK